MNIYDFHEKEAGCILKLLEDKKIGSIGEKPEDIVNDLKNKGEGKYPIRGSIIGDYLELLMSIDDNDNVGASIFYEEVPVHLSMIAERIAKDFSKSVNKILDEKEETESFL